MVSDTFLSRRNFMHSATAAGAFSIVAPQAVRGSQANSKISVGLIGSGGRGSYDAKYVNSDPRARITALCDLFDDRLEKAAAEIGVQNPKTFKDFEKLLAAPDIDAVIIATPPFEHPRMFEAAVEARKHIYCEKPMGVDFPGVQKVLKASRKADKSKTISVGFQQRYGPVYLEGYKRLKNGDIGELGTARAFWLGGPPWDIQPYDDQKISKLRNWFATKDYSGDIIIEQDCHNFDVLHWFLDARPISAVGHGGKRLRTGPGWEVMDNLSLTFVFPNDLIVNYEANQLCPKGFGRVGEEFSGKDGLLATSRAKLVHYKGPKDVETIESKRDITYDAFDDFLNRVINNEPANVGERSAISTLFAILGRTAIYQNREATWKGEFGDV
jgi:predicted dehydrogenase